MAERLNEDLIRAEKLREIDTYMETVRSALASQDYYEYVKYTNRGYVDNRFGMDLCHRIESFVFDETKYKVPQIMILVAPPQHGKSTNVTETLPSYYHGHRPDGKIIMLSYGDDLAKKFGNSNLVKVHSFGKSLFNIELDNKSPCTSQEYHIKGHNGVFLSRGLTSGVTGNSGELVIIDDPVKNKEEADSENFRNKSWEGYLANVKTRLSAQAKVLIILTRWHEDDIAGRIEAYGNLMGNVTVVRYPCECECKETDPLGREIGDALMPEIGKDRDWVQGMKADYLNDPTQGGRRTWEALFQGRPAALEGNIVQATWFRFWRPRGMSLPPVKIQLSGGEICEVEAMELPEKYDCEVQSWDCTFKDTKSSDYVCGGYWARRLADFFLLDCYHKQASFTETIDAIMAMTIKYPKATSKYIENKANGGAVINSLKHKISGIIAIEANDDKAARLNAVTPVFRSGNVYLPHPHLFPWVRDLMKEMLDFPNGANDDYVDMTSQALNEMMYDSRNTDVKVIKEGTWAYPQLKAMGYSDIDIRNAYKSGIIKLYLIPDKYKKWVNRR